MSKTNESVLNKILECIKKFALEADLLDSVLQVSTGSLNQSKSSPTQVFQNAQTMISSIQKILDESKQEQHYEIDQSLVQITASKQQLDKRISSFIEHAQQLVDGQNVQDFCGTQNSTRDEGGCARTQALFRPRPANATHLEVKRIENTEGPQMQVNSQGNWCPIKRNTNQSYPNTGIQERLHNLEHHTSIHSESIPRNVYERLKTLENRLLQLESFSPEYFTKATEPEIKRQRLSREDTTQMSIDEIDDRIRLLKQNLLGGTGRGH